MKRKDVDDPLLKCLSFLNLLKVGLRFRGRFVLNESHKDMQEPQRTARALIMPCMIRFWKRRPSDMYATLAPTWLFNARGNKGAFYQIVKVLTQIAYACVVGVATHNRTVQGWDAARLIALIAL